jgi:hypothetical protein
MPIPVIAFLPKSFSGRRLRNRARSCYAHILLLGKIIRSGQGGHPPFGGKTVNAGFPGPTPADQTISPSSRARATALVRVVTRSLL